MPTREIARIHWLIDLASSQVDVRKIVKRRQKLTRKFVATCRKRLMRNSLFGRAVGQVQTSDTVRVSQVDRCRHSSLGEIQDLSHLEFELHPQRLRKVSLPHLRLHHPRRTAPEQREPRC